MVNPRRADSVYPYPDLASVGVAYQVARALLDTLSGDIAARDGSMLELVALGTVADVSPLLDENRALVKLGLSHLNRTVRPGLKSLIREAGRSDSVLTARDIGFTLGPRLNAAGRLQHARTAFRLLFTTDANEAAQLAAELEVTNQTRQQLMGEAVAAAREEVCAGEKMPWALVLQGELYQSGLAGLVAGRLMEEFYRPAIVMEQGETESRGSARSIAEFHITDALAGCQELLTRYGGHARAAGFTVPNNQVEALRQAILLAAREVLEPLEPVPTLDIDAELDLTRVGREYLGLQDLLAPFGHANPEPLYLTRGLEVRDKRIVGKEEANRLRHLQLRLRSRDGVVWQAIAFGRAEDSERLPPFIDVVYSLKRNVWNGLESLQLEVQDWRPAGR
jgi:single-stranded-DNA-specific exonuclease